MQVVPHHSSNQNAFTAPNSKPAWMAILGLWMIAFLGTLAGAGSIMRLSFPLGALAVGSFLYVRYPILYIGFTFWMWFLTPFLSRIIDYRSGWDPSRLILVAPYLVTLITLVTFFRYLPNARRLGGLPIVLAFVAVCYSSLVGIINSSPTAVFRQLLDWLIPLTFSFHLLVNWRNYPSYSQNLQRTFFWAVLVMGAYGIYQYLVAPEWDRYWLIQSEMFTSAGQPEPMAMRIWSTMHSQGIFANAMIPGLIFLFLNKSTWKIPVSAIGYLAFLLTLVRSSWASFVLALLLFIPTLKQKIQIRIIITVLLLGILVLPLSRLDFFSERISTRLQTFTNLEEEGSFKARKSLYEYQTDIALSKLVGNGIGNTLYFDVKTGDWVKVNIDSGILKIFFTFGWLGTVPYFLGLILMLSSSIKSLKIKSDPFPTVTFFLGFSFLAQLIMGSSHTGLTGIFLWGFLAISTAGQKYYNHSFKENSNF